jgi:hypothetical protein
MTYHDRLVEYLEFFPDTAEIAVPLGMLAAAGDIPGVSVVEHSEYFNEYRAADGTVLARVVFPTN